MNRNLKVGGWVEFQDFASDICCDDGSMKDNDPLDRFIQVAVKGMRKLGCHRFGVQDIKDSLDRAGFVNVRLHTIKVPIGPWARDKRLKSAGAMMKAVVSESLGAFAAKPFNALGIPPQERKDFIVGVKESLDDKRIHRYVKLSFCYGQKGPDPVSDFESEY